MPPRVKQTARKVSLKPQPNPPPPPQQQQQQGHDSDMQTRVKRTARKSSVIPITPAAPLEDRLLTFLSSARKKFCELPVLRNHSKIDMPCFWPGLTFYEKSYRERRVSIPIEAGDLQWCRGTKAVEEGPLIFEPSEFSFRNPNFEAEIKKAGKELGKTCRVNGRVKFKYGKLVVVPGPTKNGWQLDSLNFQNVKEKLPLNVFAQAIILFSSGHTGGDLCLRPKASSSVAPAQVVNQKFATGDNKFAPFCLVWAINLKLSISPIASGTLSMLVVNFSSEEFGNWRAGPRKGLGGSVAELKLLLEEWNNSNSNLALPLKHIYPPLTKGNGPIVALKGSDELLFSLLLKPAIAGLSEDAVCFVAELRCRTEFFNNNNYYDDGYYNYYNRYDNYKENDEVEDWEENSTVYDVGALASCAGHFVCKESPFQLDRLALRHLKESDSWSTGWSDPGPPEYNDEETVKVVTKTRRCLLVVKKSAIAASLNDVSPIRAAMNMTLAFPSLKYMQKDIAKAALSLRCEYSFQFPEMLCEISKTMKSASFFNSVLVMFKKSHYCPGFAWQCLCSTVKEFGGFDKEMADAFLSLVLSASNVVDAAVFTVGVYSVFGQKALPVFEGAFSLVLVALRDQTCKLGKFDCSRPLSSGGFFAHVDNNFAPTLSFETFSKMVYLAHKNGAHPLLSTFSETFLNPSFVVDMGAFLSALSKYLLSVRSNIGQVAPFRQLLESYLGQLLPKVLLAPIAPENSSWEMPAAAIERPPVGVSDAQHQLILNFLRSEAESTSIRGFANITFARSAANHYSTNHEKLAEARKFSMRCHTIGRAPNAGILCTKTNHYFLTLVRAHNLLKEKYDGFVLLLDADDQKGSKKRPIDLDDDQNSKRIKEYD